MSTLSQVAKNIFLEAVEKYPPEQWPAYLDEKCGGNQELRHSVEELLRAHQEHDELFDRLDVTSDYRQPEQPGQMIGPYKLRERLGAGGMGVVWAAEQKHPLRRKVAVKVIKPGMDSEQVLARFEAEREALSLMDHSNIARVLDAGTTEQGRPYFVMELIRGIPITEYCDAHRLTVAERLKLFVQTCRAVQHAHLKGIIHRDLKPSNVLVTEQDGEPTPKVIDFGVAKALHGRLADASVYTHVFQAIGTLSYMSPEQAGLGAGDIDTRADIYSLGVLLFELLTGSTPFSREKLEKAAVDEAFRVIRESNPPKPSTTVCSDGDRASAISQQRGTDPKHLSRLLKGDLDKVALKTLAKDRSQRYETASALADDVMRFLKNEPVEACVPSAMYRLRKLWQAHRAVISLTAATFILLSVALVLVTCLALALARSWEETQRQFRAAREAQAVAQLESNRFEAMLYSSHVNEAYNSLHRGFLGHARSLLQRYVPSETQDRDLRKFEWHYVNNLLGDGKGEQIFELSLPAHSVSVSASGMLAVAYFETVVLIDANSGKEVVGWRLPTKRQHTTFAEDAKKDYWAFPFAVISADGRYLAYVSPESDTTLRVTDLRTNESREFPGHGQAIRKAAISPTEPILVSVDHDGVARVWDIETGVLLREKQFHDGLIWDVTISPDGKYAATSGADNLIHVWSIDFQESFTLAGHYSVPSTVDGVISIDFSPDGTMLASGAADRTIRVWDLAERKSRFVLSGHSDEVRSVAFSPDGTSLASGGRDNSVRLWDVQSQRLRAILRGPEGIPHSVTFSADGRKVFAASFDGTVTAWNAATDNVGSIWCSKDVLKLALSRDNNLLTAIEQHSRYVRRWRLRGDARPIELTPLELDGTAVDMVFIAPARLVTAADTGTVKEWDLSAENPSGKVLPISADASSPPSILQASKDGTRLAIGRSNGVISLYDVAAVTHRDLAVHDHPVVALAFSTDGQLLVSAGEHDRTILSDLSHGDSTTLLEAVHGSRSLCVNDKDLLAVGGPKQIALFDLRTRGFIPPLSTGASKVKFLDAETMVIAGGGAGQRIGEVRLWDIPLGSLRFVLMGHTGSVDCLDVSEDGSLIVTGCFGGEIRVWRGTMAP